MNSRCSRSIRTRLTRPGIKPFAAALVCAAGASTVLAADIHVPAEQPTIQMGIDAAVDGDRVLVAEGNYVESIDFRGKNIQVLATGDRDRTSISGQGHPHAVVFKSGETSAARLAGFRIEDGNAGAASGPDAFGGGILVAGTAAPEITGNLIRRNLAWLGGAGIAVIDAAAPLIHDNSIEHNQGGSTAVGGGVYVASSGFVVVEANHVIANNALRGAGIGFVGGTDSLSTPLIARNKILRNKAEWGGGIYAEGDRVRIVDNLISGNRADHGAGIRAEARSGRARLIIANNTVAHNEQGSGTEVSGRTKPAGRVKIINNIIVHLGGTGVTCEQGSGGGVIFADNLIYTPSGSTSTTTCTWKGTLLTSNPQFVGGSDTSHAFWLQPTSPAIDAGDSTAANRYNKRDLTGARRILGPDVDLGAIEFRQH